MSNLSIRGSAGCLMQKKIDNYYKKKSYVWEVGERPAGIVKNPSCKHVKNYWLLWGY